jgi:hypothetical protein
LVPLGPKEDLDVINNELVEVMKALATAHFNDHTSEIDLDSFIATPLLDIESFQRSLSDDLHETAYERYSHQWSLANNKPTIPILTQVAQINGRNKRSAAVDVRQEAWLRKRRRIDHGEVISREGGEKGGFN